MAKLIEIEDFSDPALDVYIRLTGAQLRNKLEPEKGVFIAESPMVIKVALDAGYEPLSILTEKRLINRDVSAILDRCPDIPAYCAERDRLASLTGFELTRGMLCAMRRPVLPEPEQLLENAHRIAVLEGIVDSTNIGAIFRSAAGLGIDAVLLTPTCCDPLCRRSLRVSMGTVLLIPWTRIGSVPGDWPHPGLERLSSLGFKTAAMALRDDSVSIDDKRLAAEDRLAIVLGTEGDGLASDTIADCDYTVRIPMLHNVDSLNVAAAGAVAFWELRKR